MKQYLKPITEITDLKVVGSIMGMADASNPDHAEPAPKKRTKIF